MGMKEKETLSEIQINPIKPINGLVGFVSVVIYKSLYLSSIAIYTRPEGGYRLVYPTKKVGDKNINIFHPINKEFAQSIEEEVIDKYLAILEKCYEAK